MNRAIELHDTVVGRIETTGDVVIVELSPAYVHKSNGRPGWDAGMGAWQHAVLRFVGASIDDQRQTFASLAGEHPTLPEYLGDGTLHVGGCVYPNLIPIPLAGGPAELHMVFGSGHELTIRAESIALELVGEEFDGEEYPED